MSRIRTKYKRVCSECNDIATVGYKPKPGIMCRQCRGKKQAKEMQGKNTKQEHERIRYYYFCMKCSDVRISVAKRKCNLCLNCSRKYARKEKEPYIYFDFKEMKMKIPKRYFVICPDCPSEIATREVSKSMFSHRGLYVRCKECAIKAKPKTYVKTKEQAIKETRVKHRVSKKASKEAIEREIEKNREHKSNLKNEKKKSTTPEQKLTDKEMIDLWLSKNKAVIVPDNITNLQLVTGAKTSFCKGI